MAHMQLSGYIGRRHYDCERFFVRINFCMEVSVIHPFFVQTILNTLGIISLCKFFTHIFLLNLSDYRNLKMLLFSARKNTPSTQKPLTNVRRAIILAVPPSLSGKTILSVIPVYLLSLNAGYVKTYTAASVLHFCFQFPGS